MSQEKVDRYKKEKQNRAKTLKRKKIKKALAVFILSLGVGALIGIPLGKHIYKVQKEEAFEQKFFPIDKLPKNTVPEKIKVRIFEEVKKYLKS